MLQTPTGSRVRFRTPAALVRAIGPLTQLTGSSASSLLVLQLEYWFERKPEGFYKFLAPCAHALYKPNDSWAEQLGLSRDQVKTALAKICTVYTTRTAYKRACTEGQDPFQGQMYLCYIDKRTNLTHYLRNHALAWQRLTACGMDVLAPHEMQLPGPGAENTRLPITNTDNKFENQILNNNTPTAELEKQQPIANPKPAGPPPSEAQAEAYFNIHQNLPPAAAKHEAQRFMDYYTARNWCSASGHPIENWHETARRWKPTRQPSRAGQKQAAKANTPAPPPPPRPDVPPKTKLPTEWNPALYAKLSYLQQLDYMRQLEALGWQKVRPPHGTPAIIDRWYVPPGSTQEA